MLFASSSRVIDLKGFLASASFASLSFGMLIESVLGIVGTLGRLGRVISGTGVGTAGGGTSFFEQAVSAIKTADSVIE
jgi:hypothetical protein